MNETSWILFILIFEVYSIIVVLMIFPVAFKCLHLKTRSPLSYTFTILIYTL